MGALGWLYAGSALAKAAMVMAAAPRWGPLGTAGAVLTAELVLASAMALVLRRVAGPAPARRPVLLAVAAAALAPAAGLALGAHGAGWAALAYLSAVFGAYALGGALPAGERRALRLAFGREARRELAVGGPP